MLPYFLGGGGGGVVDIGDNIYNSLMLYSASSQYLSKTFGTPTNNRVWTFSAWVKRGLLTSANDFHLFMGASTSVASNPTTYSRLSLNATTGAYAGSSASSAGEAFVSNQYKRDPAGWEHIVWVMNATGTVTTFYLGGTETGYTSRTNPSASDPAINKNGYYHRIGLFYTAEPRAFDGYLANVCFVDGQALTPAAFGRVSADTGQWVAKSLAATNTAVAAGGTWGANGFFLDFSVSSDLGNDVAAIDATHTVANDWLPVNTSTANQYTDTPTNSYCVLNQLDKNSTITVGNLKTTSAAAFQAARSTMVIPATVPIYVEATVGVTSSGSVNFEFGLCSAAASLSGGMGSTNTYGWLIEVVRRIYNQTTLVSSTAATIAAGTVVQIAADPVNSKVWLGIANSWYDTATTTNGNPAAGTNPTLSIACAGLHVWAGGYSENVTVNFGAKAFTYTPPTGFSALCTANLPQPSIIKPALHFNAKTRTGTGATYSVTGELFQPDVVIAKGRSGATDWSQYDVVRGVQKQIEWNALSNESTEATGLTAFNSDGYTAGALAQMNTNAATYIDYLLKAGGTAVSNTSGTITSSVSVNTLAGISVGTYTGTAANATVGHGLGVAPKMIITYSRSNGSGENKAVWHTGLTGGTYYLNLNSTAAQTNDTTRFNGSPSSTIFNIGTNSQTNGSGYTFGFLAFAEIEGFSKIGSYLGGGTNFPFVYCGFKPRWVMIKYASGAGGDWEIHDTARETYNSMDTFLLADSANAESSGTPNRIDAVSNGFTIRNSSGTNLNVNNGTYVFIAFAEAPQKYSTAR